MPTRQFFTLLAAAFFMIPHSAVRPITSLFAAQLGASEAQIGLITACFSLAPLFLAVITGRLIDSIGEKLPVLFGAAGTGLSLFLVYLWPTLPMLYMAQLLIGGFHFLAFVALQNRVASSATTDEERNKAVASFGLFASLGSMIGPLTGGYAAEHLGFVMAYLLFAISALIPFLIALMVIPSRSQAAPADDRQHSWTELLKISGLKEAMVVSMIILVALDIFHVYFPLYAHSIGLTPSEIGWAITVMFLAMMLSRSFLPRLVAQLGKSKVLFLFMFTGAIFYALVPLFEAWFVLIGLAALIGFGLGVVQPLTVIICYNLAPKGRTGEVLATRMAGNRLAQVVIPLIFAGLVHLTGVGAIFLLNGAMLAAGSFLSKSLPE